MGGKRVLGEGDHEKRSGAPASHQGTVRALNEVGSEWGREGVIRVCMIFLVLFSWSEIVARWCSLDEVSHAANLFLTPRVGCHLSGPSIVHVETT